MQYDTYCSCVNRQNCAKGRIRLHADSVATSTNDIMQSYLNLELRQYNGIYITYRVIVTSIVSIIHTAAKQIVHSR